MSNEVLDCGERFLLGDDKGEPGDGWKAEAAAVISDIKEFVNSIAISMILPCDEAGVYINIETKEKSMCTVELSTAGFRICSFAFDTIEDELRSTSKFFETPYALLDSLSPGYRESFSGALMDKLNALIPDNLQS